MVFDVREFEEGVREAVAKYDEWFGQLDGRKKKLEEEANDATARLEVESKARKENEELNIKLLQEKNELLSRLEAERGSMGDEIAKQQKLQAQKADLETQLTLV
ncbi:Myosin heavy chain, muscle [Amphibalanus amphitrite]|uniref:Myosin heavy chain, muscle n=1 Tax=Amphibalanus amphitrite TaxID=1232801 RepID=A0A6A4X258_AMPAM|nr:Myosin heavy chain, muscle [Amphibalanus amphitrite]